MSNMRQTATAIAAKYARMPPPEDWPIFGDDIIFTDRSNGRQYRGTVLRSNDAPRYRMNDAFWWVAVKECITTGQKADPEVKSDEWTVSKEEINSVIRQPDWMNRL